MLMMVSTEKDDVNETTTSYGLLEEEELNISSVLAWYIVANDFNQGHARYHSCTDRQ